ncbi:MAG: DNA helicase RecG, partial [Chloroflexi bacterium]|nr:DNA helicase RecG [Chloroflexota bacterium]
ALTMYADLDLTVLDELPPGRTPIETRVIHPSEREQAYSFIRHHLDKGQQAYIIYPLVEASESVQARAAVDSYEELSKSDFYEYRMGLLHGRVSAKEKDEIMSAFVAHELDVLVSTTVIEVGIDVPNATIIMIEGANRFGLAQLHQLRGRVGRGHHQSYCLLLADNATPEAMDRLRALERTTDGFELAELDWKMRGAGDLLGTRQAGASTVSLNSMIDVRMVEMAQMESRALFEEDPSLSMPEHGLLAQRIEWTRHRTTDFS